MSTECDWENDPDCICDLPDPLEELDEGAYCDLYDLYCGDDQDCICDYEPYEPNDMEECEQSHLINCLDPDFHNEQECYDPNFCVENPDDCNC